MADDADRASQAPDIYDEAIDTWGRGAQLRQLQEECGELVAAVNHYERNRIDKFALALEMADVSIMLEQGVRIVGREIFDAALALKISKVEGRLDRARAERGEGGHG